MLSDWLKDFLIQLADAPSWLGPLAEFLESVRDSYEGSPHMAHREFSMLVDGLLVAHLLELDISADDYDGLSYEIVHSTDVRLKPLRRLLQSGDDFRSFSDFMNEELPLLPQRVPGSPQSGLSLVTSVALDLSPAPVLEQSVFELPAISEIKMTHNSGLDAPLVSVKQPLSQEEISRRLERLQNLKMHIARSRVSTNTTTMPAEIPEVAVSQPKVICEADKARQDLTRSLLQDLKK
jgi:hypothetical protein